MSVETALITGASAGIGAELARCFAADGSRLVLVARRAEVLAKLAEDLRSEFQVEVLVEPCDVGDRQALSELMERLTSRGVEIDVVVNNAGFGLLGECHTLPLDRQQAMIDLNMLGLVTLTRLALPDMLKRGRGGILNVASVAGFQPGPRMAVYYASKAFVLSFTEALAEELVGTPLHVSCLCPGPTKTEFGSISGMEASQLFRLGTMTAREVAQVGHRGYRAKKVIVIPGWTNRLSTLAVRLIPRVIIRKAVKRMNS